MTFPNRELSQFASFLTINDTNKGITITTQNGPLVGIGTTTINEKLHVGGNVKVNGFVTATTYYGDGSKLSGVAAVIDGYFVSTPSGIYTGASVGIGTSSFSNKLNVAGSVGVTSNITAYTLNSSSPTGIAPLTVQSSTLVSNLNADFFRGRTPPVGNLVGDSDTQTLTDKTLTSPIISTIVNGGAQLSVPTTTGTLIHTNAVGIITSGVYGNSSILNVHISPTASISYSKINLSNSIVNSDVNSGAGISYSKLNLTNSIQSSDIDPNNKIQNDKLSNNTISGIALGSNLNTLTRGSYLTGSNYNGSTATTWAVDANTANVASTVVARDSEGIINATGFVGNGITPIGGIIMYFGQVAQAEALEPNWAVCDGRTVNGRTTPNLTDRFVVAAGGSYVTGATGGSKDAVVVSHTHSINDPGHAHSVTGFKEQADANRDTSRIIIDDDRENSSVSDQTDGNFTGITVNSTGESGTNKNLPPYYALVFLMRTA